jgi:hypothetical protein
MTASASILGADKIVVRFFDKMIALDLPEAEALHEDLSRILGRAQSQKAQKADEALTATSQELDRLSASIMRLLREVRDA